MDYIHLLVASYDLSRISHEFGKMLQDVKAEQGSIFVPTGFTAKLEEFTTALTKFAEIKAVMECDINASNEGN